MGESAGLDHIYITGRVDSRFRTAKGGGRNEPRPVDHKVHGEAIYGELSQAIAAADQVRKTDLDTFLRSSGIYLTLEGAEAAFALRLESLTRWTRSTESPKKIQWLLLAFHPATQEKPEKAVIWVADKYRAQFLKLFEQYKSNGENKLLVANIGRVHAAMLDELWTSKSDPPKRREEWWCIWLESNSIKPGLINKIIQGCAFPKLDRELVIGESHIIYVRATWDRLGVLLSSGLIITEIRLASFIDSIDQLPADEQREWVVDLASRVHPAPLNAPAVCHLDTGIFRGHQLIKGSLDSADIHTLPDFDGHDSHGHGTSMAGIALFGEHLEDLIAGNEEVHLRHRLESVQILDGKKNTSASEEQRDYASITIEAVNLPEITSARQRVFCMPVSAFSDAESGQPSLWSAAIDALAVGTDIVIDKGGQQIQLIDAPDIQASRLIIVAATNVDGYEKDHLAQSDTSPIEDPGQAWNALTVGAYTNLDEVPTHPDYRGYQPLAVKGELSPHSRTSLLFGDSKWPIKPEICLEGGNVLIDKHASIEVFAPTLTLRSTGITSDVALRSTNATSAATAQAARLAALVMEKYPDYWPETIRALLVHEAEWTPQMISHFESITKKSERARLLRRYGWGVPTERAVLESAESAVTMVIQDEISPYDDEFKLHDLRLHALPWPRAILEDMGEEEVRLRMTLSYFVEPRATRRGWKNKTIYRSHGLRFDLQAPTESVDGFLHRLNAQMTDDDDEHPQQNDRHSERWFLGSQARHLGSLHQDEWVGSAAELATCNHIAVYPVAGWWKRNRRRDRQGMAVRYALIVSLKTSAADIDLYTPIATQVKIPVEAAIEVQNTLF